MAACGWPACLYVLSVLPFSFLDGGNATARDLEPPLIFKCPKVPSLSFHHVSLFLFVVAVAPFQVSSVALAAPHPVSVSAARPGQRPPPLTSLLVVLVLVLLILSTALVPVQLLGIQLARTAQGFGEDARLSDGVVVSLRGQPGRRNLPEPSLRKEADGAGGKEEHFHQPEPHRHAFEVGEHGVPALGPAVLWVHGQARHLCVPQAVRQEHPARDHIGVAHKHVRLLQLAGDISFGAVDDDALLDQGVDDAQDARDVGLHRGPDAVVQVPADESSRAVRGVELP
mmetsp:Transcript_10043/g.23136  ORF Transcript_10043/g.23136 Transcript_10043/m.23136 type:complete len:284 (-) Transcript_10043:1249-2100(-)